MPRRFARLLVLFAATSLVAIAPAAAQSGVQVEYHLSHERPIDKGKPTVTFSSNQTLRDVEITFARADGHRQEETFERIGPGRSATVTVDQPVGRFTYEVTLRGTTSGGSEVNLGFEFQIAVVHGLEVQVLRDQIDFDAGLIPIEVNKPVDTVDLEVFDRDGNQTTGETIGFGGAQGRLQVRWESQGSVGGVRMTIKDGEGQHSEQILRPIWIDVPAQIINFETGSAEIEADGIRKLEQTRQTIKDSLKDVDDDQRTQMRLYVAGYTDTVGPASRNLTLSQSRARAIGAWFRANDVDIPIFYQGFGQEVLAVDTPDNTAEERNRRALFILGNTPPRQSDDLPRSDWTRLD